VCCCCCWHCCCCRALSVAVVHGQTKGATHNGTPLTHMDMRWKEMRCQGNTCCSFLFGCHLTATHFSHYNSRRRIRILPEIYLLYAHTTRYDTIYGMLCCCSCSCSLEKTKIGWDGDNQPEKILRSITCSLWASSSASSSSRSLDL